MLYVPEPYCVLSVVVNVVNSILFRSLSRPQFQALTDEVNAHYGDLLYFCDVRWLSHGAMLSRVCGLQQEIATFPHQKNLRGGDQFSNTQWLARLVLLTDIPHINNLNVKLQGNSILVTDIYSHITVVMVQLRLWKAQLAAGQFMHFPRITVCASDDVGLNACVGVVTS